MHAASIHEGAGFRPVEAGLRGLRGRQLICAIWGVKKSYKEAFFGVVTEVESCSATSIKGDRVTSDPTSEAIRGQKLQNS